MGKVIGIDLGTTNSCVAVMEGKEPTVILRIFYDFDALGFIITFIASAALAFATLFFHIPYFLRLKALNISPLFNLNACNNFKLVKFVYF